MELNEYESKLWSSLKYQDGEFEQWQITEILTDFYGLDSEELVKRAMVAQSYVKRLLQKVMDQRGIEYNADEKVDLESLVSSCLAECEQLEGLDISQVADESKMGDSIDAFTTNYDYDQLQEFSEYFKFFFLSFHDYMSEHIAPLIEDYSSLCEEGEDPAQEDPFLVTMFESNGNEAPQNDELWPSDDDWGTIVFPDDDIIEIPEASEKTKVTDEQLKAYFKFINSVFDITKIRTSLVKNLNALTDKLQEKKVDIYFSDEAFMEKFRAIMDHDKKTHTYRFHGTDCVESAQSICEKGLGVMRDDLNTTSYVEFSMRDVILYQRGFGGEIGSEAVVIIDEPSGVQVLEELPEEEVFNLVGSGLQGLYVQANYLVRSKYIVGYVDKLNRDIVFNPEYYDYQRFSEFSGKKKQ